MTNVAQLFVEEAKRAIPSNSSELQRNVLESFAGLVACKVTLKLIDEKLTISPELTDEEISALEDIKDNLHVLSEGDDTSPHRALVDKLLAGKTTRGR